MFTKTKIGIAVLVLGAFVAGGFALNALDVDAFGWGKWFNGDSEEWQAKMEERKAEMEEWKAMSQEEQQAKMEEFKANQEECKAIMEELKNSTEWQEATQEERKEMMQEAVEGEECFGFPGPVFPGPKGPHRLGIFGLNSDEVNYEIVELSNGVQITITSDNPEIVEKIQDFADRINNISE
jgi:hypothetical protein